MLHLALAIALSMLAGAPQAQGKTSSGELTVTAVVTSSVSVTFDAQGRQVIVVANAPADAETLRKAPATDSSTPGARKISGKSHPGHSDRHS